MATGSVSAKVGKILDRPANAPTIGTATDLVNGGGATVTFTAPSTAVGGPIFDYIGTSTPGSITATGTSSPLTFSGLTVGTSYTFTVAGRNPSGLSPLSSASNSITPSAPPTSFESIATVTVGAGGAGTVTFSSIPSTYTHLHLRILARTTSNTANDSNAIETRFNGDSANNYSAHWAYGNGSTATVASGLTMSSTFLGFANSSNYSVANFCGNIIDILDYTSTSKNKTIRVFGGNNGGAGNYQFTSGMWRNNTTAINSISMTAGAGVFAQNSHFALYGIKGA